MAALIKHLLLCGFMGSGKSSVSSALAVDLELPATDLDNLIAQNAGQTIGDIFQNRGEAAFRELEHSALEQVLDTPPQIIALGGGTTAPWPNFMAIKRRTVLTVYLQTSFENCCNRIKDSDRPLLKQPEEALRQLYDKRRLSYEAIADITIPTDNMSVPEVAAALKNFIIKYRIYHE